MATIIEINPIEDKKTMPKLFEKGNTVSVGHGRPKGSGTGGQAKNWFLNQMYGILNEGGPEEVGKRLRSLRDTDIAQYLQLFIHLLPKEQQIDINSRFASWSMEELREFIATGHYPVGADD